MIETEYKEFAQKWLEEKSQHIKKINDRKMIYQRD